MTESAPKVFEPAYYRRLHEVERKHWWASGMRRAMFALLKDHLARRGTIRIHDVGCGTGFLLDRLRERSDAVILVGSDRSLDGLLLRDTWSAIHPIVADGLRLPHRDGAFDVVVCIDTIQHVTSGRRGAELVDELGRILAPGGILYLRTNSAMGHRSLGDVDESEYRRYRRDELETMARNAGLDVERSTCLNMLPSIWGAIHEYLTPGRADHHEHDHEHDEAPALSIRPYPPWLGWLNALLGAILAFEATMIGAGIDLPFGHSIALVARRPTKETV